MGLNDIIGQIPFEEERCSKKGPELKINISFISIVNFVDLNNTNKKVNEGDLLRSLFWPTEVVKRSKNSLFWGKNVYQSSECFD